MTFHCGRFDAAYCISFSSWKVESELCYSCQACSWPLYPCIAEALASSIDLILADANVGALRVLTPRRSLAEPCGCVASRAAASVSGVPKPSDGIRCGATISIARSWRDSAFTIDLEWLERCPQFDALVLHCCCACTVGFLREPEHTLA